MLASSSADQASREDPTWGHGAFTKAVLEALGTVADANHDGLISVTELFQHVGRSVQAMIRGAQTPAPEIRFDGTLFAVR